MDISISSQLYTAFFKGKVQQQLQDLEAIFSILKSLGYDETEQDEVSVENPDTGHALWVSLELFLVQQDLEVIKEIMEFFPENKCTLKDIIRARARNTDVEGARRYLWSKISKRQKRDVGEGGDAAQSKQVNGIHGEGIDAKLPDVNETTLNGYSSSTAAKDPPLLNTCEVKVMDGDDSSAAGFPVTKEQPSAAASTDPGEDTIGNRLFSNMNFADLELYGVDHTESQLRGGRHHGLDTHYDASPYARPTSHAVHIAADTGMGGSHSLSSSNHTYHLRSANAVSQSETILTATRVMDSTTATKGKVAVRALPQGQGTSGCHEYANLRGISSSANQPVVLPTDVSRKVTPTGPFFADPMNVTQKGRSQEEQNNLGAHSNRIAEGDRSRPTGPAGTTDLNSDLKHHLTLSSTGVDSRDIASQRLSETSKERRPYDSHRHAAEKDGIRSQDKSADQTHMSKQKNISSAQAVNYPRRCTAEVKGYKVEKIQTKGAQPVDKMSSKDLTSSVHQAAAVQYPVHSSRIGPNSEDALTGRGSSLATKEQHNDPTAMCDMCMADSNSICKNCFRPVCGKCVEFFNTDLCGATKGQHNFVELKKKSPPISTNLEALSNQPGANVNRETESDNKTWSCSRCTFLNSPEHGICAMCASSRGVNLVDQTEPGSRVCRNCTFHNKADAKVCMQCGKTLDLSETVV